MKNRYYLLIVLGVIVILIVWLSGGTGTPVEKNITAPVKHGDFSINVTITGELEARTSEKIYGPNGVRDFRIWNLKIEDIIPDGTVVDSGQYIARLDRSELSNRLKDEQNELEKLESQFIKTKLDTSMTLRAARDELINLKFALEEKKIKLEQSVFEPPATIRQYEIDLDKGERAYSQAVTNYGLKKQKAEADMQEVSASLNQSRRKFEQMMDLLSEFTITAPKAGMVIYKRNWDGSKMGIGATVGAWDPVVAELPDLTKMISKTYVNEIDISKIKTGQKVDISVDAFPDKHFTGEVTEVANIGEQMKNSNAKVFEVKVDVHEFDSILRPAMTTKNIITTDVINDVTYIPLEAVHSNDSMVFVYKSNRIKQQIITGKSNENEVIVIEGLAEGEEVLLSVPEDKDKYKVNVL
ncbi:MAG: HlyD family efflux transporter periplasmic adaptor subunit [Bacteroidia bacterium]|nr:efflux RND transporter periplasmic adaptor subunit [Bacteroidales bacterium]NCD41890.1 HlyD family efflux transporter periplasmic adaptor subunit [Bacteroidia bacterium]MDD2323043.1 efflux RND transporter periplasmic adaptor subunit [Bacteroidales bacterium]MDD3011580.1 efflux RND transporter periplasmic adaptor subunit [Bacteroidales bacterium]MDD3962058.1 efflux RND transporter periplasmic adaptor subunit [Bacteroidales bacterium]